MVKNEARRETDFHENHKLEANTAHSVSVQGSDSGRAESEAATEGGEEAPKEVIAQPGTILGFL
jgi:hypothetical protein